jgi:hypothetical protein
VATSAELARWGVWCAGAGHLPSPYVHAWSSVRVPEWNACQVPNTDTASVAASASETTTVVDTVAAVAIEHVAAVSAKRRKVTFIQCPVCQVEGAVHAKALTDIPLPTYLSTPVANFRAVLYRQRFRYAVPKSSANRHVEKCLLHASSSLGPSCVESAGTAAIPHTRVIHAMPKLASVFYDVMLLRNDHFGSFTSHSSSCSEV